MTLLSVNSMKDDKYINYGDSCSDFAGISILVGSSVKALTVFRFISTHESHESGQPRQIIDCLTPANKSIN